MSEIKNNQEQLLPPEVEDQLSFFNVQFVIKTLVLNWMWFVLSLVIFIGLGALYLRYTQPVYQIGSKMLIKNDDNRRRSSNQLMNSAMLGTVTMSDGFDNELEILKSTSIAEGAIRDLKLYVNYSIEGNIVDRPIYESTPLTVDMDQKHLDKLTSPVRLEIDKKDKNEYEVRGTYSLNGEPHTFRSTGAMPMSINVKVGTFTIIPNYKYINAWTEGRSLFVTVSNPTSLAYAYAGGISVEPLSKTTTIARLVVNDVLPQRGIDYLKQVAVVYNRQANEDKNEIAVRTEEFINERLEKINAELGSTDGAIASFKRSNNIVDASSNAGSSLSQTDQADNALSDMNTQIMLMESIKEYMAQPSNKYQTLPSNVGLKDGAATSLITQYNNIALERNRLLRSASEMSPAVQTITGQLDDLTSSINRAIDQSKRTMEIERNSLMNRFSKYQSKLSQTPHQERILTEIGRQQTVKSSLYIMLLQKREENSISLAATADKGKLVDEPLFMGKVKPKSSIIMLVCLVMGIALPFIFFFLMELSRYRIEGHADVEKLTKAPIIADVAQSSQEAKTRGDIVVHENKNNQMEEIFRAMRTNLQFMLKENENVIMFTSATSGEGKTFTAANLAVSFALLDKKVVLVGLDIRRPRLAQLFELSKSGKGVSTLLTKENPTESDIKEAIVPSEVNKNLDLLLAGPVPPNPAELIARPSLDKVFEILRKTYDYVIVDTAPIGLVSDTLQAGRITDVTVIVCRADYTEKSAFGMINELVYSEKLPNVCVVINGIDMSRKKYGYAYGYGKYGHYSKYGRYGYKSSYGKYGSYGAYSSYGSYGYHSYGYGTYSTSHYGNADDNSIKQ